MVPLFFPKPYWASVGPCGAFVKWCREPDKATPLPALVGKGALRGPVRQVYRADSTQTVPLRAASRVCALPWPDALGFGAASHGSRPGRLR